MSTDPKYLVIGGTGVIGNFVTRQLAKAGHTPVVMTASGNTDLIADVLDRTTVVKGDIVDGESLAELVGSHGITGIAHLGANVGVEGNPVRSARVYVEGTLNVLEAARLNGVKRVVFTSTKGVYGPVTGKHAHPTYEPLTEDLPCEPATIRGSYKLACEHAGRIYRRRHGIEFTALRFSSTVGPAKTQRHGDTSVHSKMIENAMLGVECVIENGGDAVTDIIYNDDAAGGIIAALTAEGPTSELYNIGAGFGITLAEFAEGVRAVYPEARFDIGPGTQYLHPDTTGHCVLDSSRAKRELDFEPRYDTVSMVRAYVGLMETLGIEPVAT
ncbi:MAG: NAD-dependent epimerase/dehydratase family protein [Dehalococcoidia bacterium]